MIDRGTVEPQFIGVWREGQDEVKAAVSAATKHIAEAYQYLVNPPSHATGDRYTAWFGEDEPQRRAYVENILKNLTNTDLADFVYDGNISINTEPDSYGYIYPDQFGTIYLGPAFWNAAPTGWGSSSQAGFLVREASRFLDNGGTQEHEDGHDDLQALARESPALAITNADSYAYFVENYPPLN